MGFVYHTHARAYTRVYMQILNIKHITNNCTSLCTVAAAEPVCVEQNAVRGQSLWALHVWRLAYADCA